MNWYYYYLKIQFVCKKGDFKNGPNLIGPTIQYYTKNDKLRITGKTSNDNITGNGRFNDLYAS